MGDADAEPIASVGAEADAGTAALAALRAIGARIAELEPAAMADEPDAVHQLRTHVRRLRSLLAAFVPLFDPSAAVYRDLGAWVSARRRGYSAALGDRPGGEPRQPDHEFAGPLDETQRQRIVG